MKNLVITLVFMLAASAVSGQGTPNNAVDPSQTFEDALLNQFSELNYTPFQAPPSTPNDARIFQSGNNNQSDVTQSIPSGSPASNEIILIQNGNLNQSDINMTGENNSFGGIQNGNQNTLEMDLYGNDINSQILQEGNNNEITQTLSVDGKSYVLIQEGNSNYIDQWDYSPTSTGIMIHQKGNGMNLIIRNSSVVGP